MADELGFRIALALALTIAAVLAHIVGSGVLLLAVRRNMRHIHHARPWRIQIPVLTTLMLGLVALHGLEIAGFALAYLAVGAVPDLETALFYSTASYATVGVNGVVADDWRLLGAWEGLIGFILIGWSTALFLAVILRIWSEDHRWFAPKE